MADSRRARAERRANRAVQTVPMGHYGHHHYAGAAGHVIAPAHWSANERMRGLLLRQVVHRASPAARREPEGAPDHQGRDPSSAILAEHRGDAVIVGGADATRGCLALAPALRLVVWPKKFKPSLPQRYDGTTSPVEFLLRYVGSIRDAGGDDRVMANWLPLAFKGVVRSWLMGLPEASVSSWEDLRERFVANFRDVGGFAPTEGGDGGSTGNAGGSQGPRAIACILGGAHAPVSWPTDTAGVAAGTGRTSAPSRAHRSTPCAGGMAREVPPPSPQGSGSSEPRREAPQGDQPRIFLVVLQVPAMEFGRGRDRDGHAPDQSRRLFCAYHIMRTHNTEDCKALKPPRGQRPARRPSRNHRRAGRREGLGGGTWDDRRGNPREVWGEQPREVGYEQPREGGRRIQSREGTWVKRSRDKDRCDRPRERTPRGWFREARPQDGAAFFALATAAREES